MDFDHNSVLSSENPREFGYGHKCFSISSFFTFLQVILLTIVNVNNNMNNVSEVDTSCGQYRPPN